VRPEVPRGLDEIMQRMMARQPADRYQTPAEVAAALGPCAAALVADVPNMQLDDRTRALIPVAVNLTPVSPAAPAQPVLAALPFALPVEPVELANFAGAGDVFEARGSSPAGESVGLAESSRGVNGPARRKAPAPAKTVLNPRMVVPIVAGGAFILILLLTCGGYLLLGGSGKKGDGYPADAALQITEATIAAEVMRPGQVKSVIVRLRRVNFLGPVELRLEGLPPGVTAPKTVVPAATVAAELRVTVPFGTDPCESNIRVVAKAKNLTAERSLRLQIVADKKLLGKNPRN
jgi:hypothetical protein